MFVTRLFFTVLALTCFVSFADDKTPTPAPQSPAPATPQAPAPQPPHPQAPPAGQGPGAAPLANANVVCFCADNVTGLQGCAVGAVRRWLDATGAPSVQCLDPQVSIRPASQSPSYLEPEACRLQDVHTGEIRPGNVQCIETGALRCQ